MGSLRCKNATIPKSRTAFWLEKLNKNVLNDKKNIDLLTNEGWKVIVVWECELEKHFEETMKIVVNRIKYYAC